MVTKEIIVYSDVERNTRITSTEKTLILDELENNSGIGHVHFMAFAEGCEDVKFGNTNIPSLMLKNISNYIRPIINISGYSISIQFNKPILTIDGKKTIQIGTDNQIDIYGFHFNNYEQNFRSITAPTALSTSTFNERIISGTYALKINDVYFQQSTGLQARKKSLEVKFRDEESAVKDISLITKYVLHLEHYYNDCIHYLYWRIAGDSVRSLPSYIPRREIVKKGELLFMDNIYPNSLNIIENGSIDIVSFFDIINEGIWNIYALFSIYGEKDKRVLAAIENEVKKQKINKREQVQQIKNQRLLFVYRHKAIIANRLFGKVLNKLTVDEKNIIELTYKKNIEYDEFLRSCNCRHINLVKTAKHKNSPEWEELKKILSNGADGMLNCSLCNMPAMCPHIYDKMESDNADDTEYKDNILRKYAGKTPILDTYYCKICGGVLYKIFMEVSTDFERKEEINDLLQSRVWKIVKSILLKRVIFTVATNINKLVTSIVDSIMPYIEDANKDLRKSKNNTMEIVNDSLTIYIYLYTYALLARIVAYNKNEIRFNVNEKTKKGAAESATNSKELQLSLGKALSMVIQDSDTVLKKISNITTSMLKPLFINAYKNIAKTFIIEIETDDKLSPEHIINCSEYNILYVLKKKYDRSLQYTDIKKILNVEMEEVSGLDNVLDKVILPKTIWEASLNKHKPGYYNNVKYINLNSQYLFLSYMHFLKYSKEKIFRTNILTSLQFAEHTTEYYAIKKMEDSLLRTLQNRTMVTKYNHGFMRVEREAKLTRLSRYYCNSGKKHIFDIHVYEKGASVLYVKTKSLKEWLFDDSKNAEITSYKYADVKCSLCDVLLTDAYNGNTDELITNSILGNENIVDFYVYFTDRCPINNAHAYENNTCTKCGVTKKMIYGRDKKYYEKYISDFNGRTITRTLPKIEMVPTPVEDKNYKQWVPVKTAMAEVSSIFNTSINIISNIGSIEGLDYKSVESGMSVQHKSRRTQSLDTYTNSFIIDYEMLRNSNTEQSPHLEHLAKAWENIDFSKFPDLPTKYHEEKAVHESNKLEHEKLSNFILHTLLSYILYIYKYYDGGDERKAAREFSLLSIKRVVDNEFKISNHGRYFKSLIEEDDTIDDEVEEVIEKEEFNPFDNMDMDTGIKNFRNNTRLD